MNYACNLKVGGFYKIVGQTEIFVFLGTEWQAGVVCWFQFALASRPKETCCELMAQSLYLVRPLFSEKAEAREGAPKVETPGESYARRLAALVLELQASFKIRGIDAFVGTDAGELVFVVCDEDLIRASPIVTVLYRSAFPESKEQ